MRRHPEDGVSPARGRFHEPPRPPVPSWRLLFLLGPALLGLACGGDSASPSAPESSPPAREPTTIHVRPADTRLLVGNARHLSATVVDQFGDTMPGQSVSWSADDYSVVTVTRGGQAEAVGGGTTSVVATAGTASGAATISVPEPHGTIGRDGGDIVAAEGRVTLGFPAEAIISPTAITVVEALADSLPDPEPENGFVEGTAYEFGPAGTTFRRDATLGLDYDPADLPEGVSQELLRLHRLEDGSWSKISSSMVDPESNRVTGSISTFSIYAVLAIEDDPPVVTITSPEDGATFDEGTSVTLEGTAEDTDDGTIEGESLAWESDVDGALGTGGSLSVANLSTGAHVITLKATDSDHLTGSSSVAMTISAVAPDVSISTPEDGTTIQEGDPVTLEGSAQDAGDGALDGESLVWESDIDGRLGTGTSLEVTSLSVGTHAITLTATDSDGLTGSTSIELTVDPLEPPDVTITAPTSGAVFALGSEVTLEGTATDPEDDVVPDENLTWESDRDGVLGTGSSLVTDALSRGEHILTLTATDSDGMTGSDQITVTVEIPTLEDEVPVEDLSGDEGSRRYFQFEVSGGSAVALREIGPGEMPYDTVTMDGSGSSKDPGADGGSASASSSDGGTGTVDGGSASLLDATLQFALSGGSGDADLYVRHGELPTLSTYACRPYRVGNEETCEFQDPADGTWFVMIHGYQTYSGTTLQADLRLDSEPVATILQPSDGSSFDEGTAITFEGTGEDLEDGTLTGSALVWTSDLDGELGTGQSLTVSSLTAGTHVITLTVTDSDGATDQASLSLWIDGSPSVTLSQPGQHEVFQEGELVSFSGSGDDFADGALTGSALAWTSSADGSLGTGESVTTSDLSPGPHHVTLTATDSDGYTASASIDILVESPGFDIRLRPLANLSDSQLATIESALAPWESAIVGDLSPRFLSGSLANDCFTGTGGIDDLVVVVVVQSIDGFGGVLARAAPCAVRVNGLGQLTTPVSGYVIIDEADLGNAQLEQIVTHEVGHVLGIGIEALHGWGSNAADLASQDPGFHGSNAVTAFNGDLDGEAYLDEGIPLANTGGPGTNGGHWRELNFDAELMTGYINSGVYMPLSRVTVGALADIGYEVDMNAADAYTLPMPQRALWLAEADATLSAPTSSGSNFGLPDGSTLGTSLVAGANYDQAWSTDPESEVYSSLLRVGAPSSLPTGVRVESATLVLNRRTVSFETSNHLVEVVPVTSSWSESGVTWDSRPGVGDSPVHSFDFQDCSLCQLRSTGLRDLTVSWLEGTAPNNGLLLRSPDAATDSTYSVGYWSRHSSTSARRPLIRVEATTEAPAVAAVPPRATERIPLGDDIAGGRLYGVGPTGRVERVEQIRGP